MCGIVGYIGKEKVLPILIDGLKNLEYRGYDSAGVMVFGNGNVCLEKAVGRIKNLEAKLGGRSEMVIRGGAGIAHTRWATHGGVSEKNSHPHSDCAGNIYVVHNGIIENFKELKECLSGEGHKFVSETDTEVLPHLIEELKKKYKDISLEEAVRLALREIKGTYGIIVFSADEPGKLVAARNFSPLMLGIGDGEFIFGSDANAILSRTNNVVYLKNSEIAVVDSSYRIFNIDNEPIERKAEVIEGMDVLLAKKGGYPHYLLKEICEQPESITNSIRGRLIVEKGKAVLGGLQGVEEKLRDARRVIVGACGSAYLAGKVGEYFLEEYAGIPTDVEFASEFRYRKPILSKRDVFLAVSQSGETADTLASMAEAREKGLLTLGIVNAVGSTIRNSFRLRIFFK